MAIWNAGARDTAREASVRLRMRGAGACLLLVAALGWAPPALAARTTPAKPGVATGGVKQARGGSVLLQGIINPHGAATTYHFDYGPTATYGSQTPSAALPAGFSPVRIGQIVAAIRVGYHYRLTASNAFGPAFGKDHVYAPKTTRLKFDLPKIKRPVPYGHSLVITGALTGVGNAGRRVALQESPFPYLGGFLTVAAAPQVTGTSGRFSFRVSTLLLSTQFRVITLDPRPLLSRPVTAQVSVRVTFKVRSSARRGLVRMYGTVTPAQTGAKVLFQLQKAVKPGSRGASEKAEERAEERGEPTGVRFATQASTVVKRATKSFSRFSLIVKVRTTGRYRALVVPKKGAFVAGYSQTILIHAAPSRKRARH